MGNTSITIDNTTWSTEVVKSFTTISSFVEAHASCDWFTEEYLKQVYSIIVTEDDKTKGKNK